MTSSFKPIEKLLVRTIEEKEKQNWYRVASVYANDVL